MSPTSEPMTSGEVARSLSRIERGLNEVNVKMDTRPSWEDVKRIETQLCADITKLEGTVTWVSRTVGGAIILAVIGFIVGIPIP